MIATSSSVARSFSAKVEAVHAGQHHVEQDQVGRLVAGEVQRTRAVVGRRRLETRPAQGILHRLPDDRVVFHDEDVSHVPPDCDRRGETAAAREAPPPGVHDADIMAGATAGPKSFHKRFTRVRRILHACNQPCPSPPYVQRARRDPSPDHLANSLSTPAPPPAAGVLLHGGRGWGRRTGRDRGTRSPRRDRARARRRRPRPRCAKSFTNMQPIGRNLPLLSAAAASRTAIDSPFTRNRGEPVKSVPSRSDSQPRSASGSCPPLAAAPAAARPVRPEPPQAPPRHSRVPASWAPAPRSRHPSTASGPRTS